MHLYPPTLRGKFNGIGQEIADDLLKAIAIAQNFNPGGFLKG